MGAIPSGADPTGWIALTGANPQSGFDASALEGTIVAGGIAALAGRTQSAVIAAKQAEVSVNALWKALSDAFFAGLTPDGIAHLPLLILRALGGALGIDVSGWVSVVTALAELASFILDLPAVVTAALQQLIDYLFCAFTGVSGITGKTALQLFTALEAFYLGGVTVISDVATLLNYLYDILTGAVGSTGKTLANVLTAGNAFYASVAGLIANFETLLNNLYDWLNGTVGSTGKSLANVLTAGQTFFTTVATNVTNIATGATNFQTLLNNLFDAFNGTTGSTGKTLANVFSIAQALLSTLTTATTNITTAAANFQTLLNNLFDAFNGSSGSTGKTLANVLSTVQTWYTAVNPLIVAFQTLLNNLFDALNGTTGSTGKTLANVFTVGQAFYTGAAGAATNLATLLNNLFDAFNGSSGSTGKTLANVLSTIQTWYTAVNPLISGVETAVDALANAFTGGTYGTQFVPTFDAIGAGNSGSSSGAPIAETHVLAATATGIIAIATVIGTLATPTVTAEVGTTSMTALAPPLNYYAVGGNYFHLCLFGLESPPTGSQSVSVTVTGETALVGVQSVSYNHVAGFGAVTSNTGLSTTPTLSVSAVANELVAQVFSGFSTTLAGYNQTARVNDAFTAEIGGDNLPFVIGDAPGAATVNFGCSEGTQQWAGIGVRLQPPSVIHASPSIIAAALAAIPGAFITGALNSAVTLGGVALSTLSANWNASVTNLQTLLNNLFDAFNNSTGSTGKTLANVFAAGQGLYGFIQSIIDGLHQLFSGGGGSGFSVASLLTAAQGALHGLLPAAVHNFDGTVSAVTGITFNGDGTVSYVPGVNDVQTLINQADGTFASVADTLVGAANGAVAQAGQNLTNAVNNVQPILNGLFGQFMGLVTGVPATPASVNTAVAGHVDTVSTHAVDLAGIKTVLGSGNAVAFDFSTFANGRLSVPWLGVAGLTTQPTVSGQVLGGILGNGGITVYDFNTATNYQTITVVFGNVSVPAVNCGIIGRSDNLIGNFVLAYFLKDQVSISANGYSFDGSSTVTHSLIPGAKYTLACGDFASQDPGKITLYCNGTPIVSCNDTAHATVGADRRGGLDLQAPVAGVTDPPPGVTYFSVEDSGTVSSVLALPQSYYVLPPTTGWVSVNAGTTTLVTDRDTLLATAPSIASGESYHLYMQTLSPAINYTKTFCIETSALPANSWAAGIVLRNSTSGLFHLIDFGCSTATVANTLYLRAGAWTAPSPPTLSTVYSTSAVGFLPFLPKWWRFRDDGTNRYSEYSLNDGIDWVTYHTIARTSFMTPDQVGFVIFNSATGSPMYMRIRSGPG